LQSPAASLPVGGDSPATDVMTDLSRVAAVTTSGGATIRAARESMITHGVRALFVVDETRAVLGIVTSTDIDEEKPIQIAQQRREAHDEVLVREVMTPAERVEAMDFDDVLRARVGDIIQTLRDCGRQHALVIESVPGGESTPTHVVRGIFSLTQIARQLGLSSQPSHDVARTFAEIEAAIGP
jgi:CBS-domain-containing membrane protein